MKVNRTSFSAKNFVTRKGLFAISLRFIHYQNIQTIKRKIEPRSISNFHQAMMNFPNKCDIIIIDNFLDSKKCVLAIFFNSIGIGCICAYMCVPQFYGRAPGIMDGMDFCSVGISFQYIYPTNINLRKNLDILRPGIEPGTVTIRIVTFLAI